MFSIKDKPDVKSPQLLSEAPFISYGPDEISLAAVFHTIVRRKRIVLRNAIIAAAVAIPAVFLLPVKYTAEAVILTPQPAQPSLSTMAQLSGSGSLSIPGLSLLAGFPLRNPADLYIGILKSRSIADVLIHQFQLQEVYSDKYLVTARKHLAHNTTIETGKDALIHVLVEDRDPRRAAALANAYVDELSKQNSRLALAEASQRRSFYESQLAREKDALADAEIAMRNTQQATGLVSPVGQTEALVRSGAQLRVEILTRQAQLEAMKTYASDENPRLQLLKRELGALQGELAKIEHGNSSGALNLATKELPQSGLEYLRRTRDLRYHETLFEILAKQYEAARLDEAKSTPLVQILDRAVVPEKKSWPPRTIFVLAAICLTAIGTSFWLLLANSRKGLRQT